MKITESRLRRIIRQVIQESNSELEDVFAKLGIDSEEEAMSMLIGESVYSAFNESRLRPSNRVSRSRREFEKAVKYQAYQIQRKMDNLPPEKRSVVISKVAELRARREIGLFDQCKSILQIMGLSMLFLLPLACLICISNGHDITWLQESFPNFYSTIVNILTHPAALVFGAFAQPATATAAELYADRKAMNQAEMEKIKPGSSRY